MINLFDICQQNPEFSLIDQRDRVFTFFIFKDGDGIDILTQDIIQATATRLDQLLCRPISHTFINPLDRIDSH